MPKSATTYHDNAHRRRAVGRRGTLHGCVVAALTLALLWPLCSCNTTGCSDNRSSIPLAGFYSYASGKAIAIDSIDVGGVGAPADSLLIDMGRRVSHTYLPLRQTASTASFFIAYRQTYLDGVADTITFDYQSYPYFVSEECGAMLRYRVTSLRHTHWLIDSVALIAVDSVITNANAENIKIYFRTSEK